MESKLKLLFCVFDNIFFRVDRGINDEFTQHDYTEDFSQGVMVSCNGFFFFNVVCCQVSTNNVHSYQLSCGLDYIALCHVIAYVCFFICSSLFI